MKRIFSLFAAVLMAATMFAGRTFSAGDKLYMDCGAVAWWCNDGVSQTMYFADASDATTSVVGTVYGEEGSKIYEFACPAGEFEYIYEQRGTWNTTGHITLIGTEGKDLIKSFSENGTTATWGNLGDAPDPDVTHYLYVTDRSAHWDKLYVYAWGGKEFFGAWPGASVRDSLLVDGKYKLAMTGQSGAAVNLIFHNGVDGHQYNSDVYSFTADHNVTTLDPDAPVEVADTALFPKNAVLTQMPAQVRVLSINNSLIDYNDQYQLFNDIAAAMGKDATWTKHTNLGKTLNYHFDSDPLVPNAQTVIATTPYTHIVLQEQSGLPRTDFATFRAAVIRWVNYIRTNGANPQAVIILPVNWAYNTESAEVYAAYNAAFMENYTKLAQELGLVLCPMAKAYQIAVDDDANWKTTTGLYSDDRHPTLAASYMAACAEYSVIFGEDATTITQKPAGITEAVATSMRGYAKAAIDATPQAIDHVAGKVYYNLYQVDAQGSLLNVVNGATFSATGGTMTNNVFTCTTTDEYTITATLAGHNYTTTAHVGTFVPEPTPELPSIKVNATNKVVAENFDTIGYPAADATVIDKGYYGTDYALPTAWRMERNQSGPRTIGAYADAMETAQYAGGVSLPTGAANGTWNLGTNGNSDRALGGMTTGVAGGARTINVMTHLENDGTTDFASVAISYDIEKYREGSNANLFYVKLFTSTNGVAWTEAGDAFTWMNPAGSGQTGFATVPGFTQHVEGTLNLNFQAGTELYLCWSISTSAGDNCASAPCLAIDNVRLEFSDDSEPEPEPEYAGIEFSESAATYTQDFNTLPYPAAGATAISGLNGVYGMGSTLPTGWRAARVESTPRSIASYASAPDTLQYQGGVSLPSNAKNGTWNLGMNGSTDRAIGGMTTDAAGGARTINIMAYIKNTDTKPITSLALSYNVEKYRDGSNANLFYVKLFTSVDGIEWTAVENNDFDFINPKGSAQTGFATVPDASTTVSGTLNETIEAGKWLHLCWQIATSTGTTCQAAPCLAIDDVQMTASYGTATSLEQNAAVTPSQKRLVNGQIVIIRDGVRYTILGARL